MISDVIMSHWSYKGD